MNHQPHPGGRIMQTDSSATEAVVRNHLQAFLEQRGIPAIVDDYAESAQFYTGTSIYRGKQEIGHFFTDFIGSLPTGAIERFTLTSLLVEGGIAYITWQVNSEIPLGTDTFVVENGKIVSQTFAMYYVPAPVASA
jgi:ketosteroid isomerase-like protein